MSITRDYKNILVINLMHIGDLMLVTPVLRTLRTNYPQARISLLADKKLADLVQYNRHIDECLLIDKKGRDDSLPSFIKYIWGIRKKKFDLVINLHRNERASAIAAFSGADRIVGYAKPGFALLFDKVLPNLKAVKHQIHSHFDVLEQAVGIDRIDDGGLEMWLPEVAVRSADKIWQENFAPDKKVVAFNIGASWKTKRWIDTYFARCADELLAKGYGVAFFGGPMDTELVEACIAQMKHRDSGDIKVFTGKVSLGELGALLKKCALFLTTDSGPMHVGVSQNVPVVTMFGASPVPGFYPYDARDVLIKTPEPCHPCGIHECPKKGEDNMACMKKITVAIVMKYVWELLGKYEKQAGKMPREYGKYECRVIDMAKM
ncbi:MAG: glycosyltransferase family 9 protein [Selenomonadaceae bacterium]|nr:glycosyltransferase family 9 protein [Selenomonadaceae bacterium]